ncbi:MAG TPA: general secretion pathway protein GspK [Dissulfurispiraceae bacterium]|nr:general secretion pathway protein GspK [Dissulfurispiraceae bacterium]
MLNGRHNDKGIALILVIWTIAILMVIVLSFAYMTKVESSSMISYKEGVEEKFIAEAGMARAAEEIIYRQVNLGAPREESKSDIWKTDGTPNAFTLGDGMCLVRIVNEGGKIDINKTPDIVLRGLLIALGIKDDDADIIVDSIEDWRDSDDLVRLHGAESDYYMALPVPYKAKNSNFESVEELLLVRGMTREILYGSEKKAGLADFVTVYNDNGKINISSAPKEVLMAIPGMVPELAENILEFRKDAEIRNIADIQALAGGAYKAMEPFITAGESTIYTVESVGRSGAKKPGYGIKAVVVVSGENVSYRYFKGPWDMSKWKQQEQ